MATRQAQQAKARAALRQRVRDMMCGAVGSADPDRIDDFWATLEQAERIIPAILDTFLGEGREWMCEPASLANYETVDALTDFLFDEGIRANTKPAEGE